jgi:Domain of Unknown Function (DUF1080)
MKSIITFLALSALASAHEIPLFNGKDLSNWSGDSKFWSVEDGVITGQTSPTNPAKTNGFLIWKGEEVSDFTLEFQYKMTPGDDKKYANSGVQYRSRVIDAENFIVGGYQADLEYGDNYSGILYEERGRGILAKRGDKVVVKQGAEAAKPILEVVGKTEDPSVIQSKIKKDDWNHYRIVANGNKVQHYINGLLTIEVTDITAEAPKAGVIALQIHGGPPMKIQYKDLILNTD